mgnify:FL=1
MGSSVTCSGNLLIGTLESDSDRKESACHREYIRTSMSPIAMFFGHVFGTPSASMYTRFLADLQSLQKLAR